MPTRRRVVRGADAVNNSKWLSFAAISIAIVFLGSALYNVKWFSRFSEPRINVNAIVRNHIPAHLAPTKFVNRTLVGTFLQRWFDNNEENTLIVYGPRGGGKTTLVHNALAKQTGVIDVAVSASRSSIACAVVARLQLTHNGEPLPCQDDDLDRLKQLFDEASAMLGGVRPVIVVDVRAESETAEAVAHSVVRQAKQFVVDKQMARCILIFSDATLVFALNEDTARRALLFVDSFTVDEANQFVDQYQLPSNASFREELFKQIGTRPADLQLVQSLLRISMNMLRRRIGGRVIWWGLGLQVLRCTRFSIESQSREMVKCNFCCQTPRST